MHQLILHLFCRCGHFFINFPDLLAQIGMTLVKWRTSRRECRRGLMGKIMLQDNSISSNALELYAPNLPQYLELDVCFTSLEVKTLLTRPVNVKQNQRTIAFENYWNYKLRLPLLSILTSSYATSVQYWNAKVTSSFVLIVVNYIFKCHPW